MSAEIDEYPSLRFQDIRKKSKCHGWTHGRTDGRTDNVKTVYPTTNKVCRGYKKHCMLLKCTWFRALNSYQPSEKAGLPQVEVKGHNDVHVIRVATLFVLLLPG